MLPVQATVRDVAAILFAKQFACEAIEIRIIYVRFRSFEIMLITRDRKWLDNSKVAIIRDIGHSHAKALTGWNLKQLRFRN